MHGRSAVRDQAGKGLSRKPIDQGPGSGSGRAMLKHPAGSSTRYRPSHHEAELMYGAQKQ
jgi:hypothetical protein